VRGDAIENFADCAVVISHDRIFLDRLATRIQAFEGKESPAFTAASVHA